MQWYEGIIEKLEFSRTYSHKELLGLLKRIKPNLADTTYHWSISCLIRDGKIFRRGYDAYSLSQGEELREAALEFLAAVERDGDDAINVLEPSRPGQLDAEQMPVLAGQRVVSVVFDLMHDILHHRVLPEDQQRRRRLDRDAADEPLLDVVAWMVGTAGPCDAGHAGGAEVPLVAHQRLATVAAEVGEEDAEEVTQRTDDRGKHGA